MQHFHRLCSTFPSQSSPVMADVERSLQALFFQINIDILVITVMKQQFNN